MYLSCSTIWDLPCNSSLPAIMKSKTIVFDIWYQTDEIYHKFRKQMPGDN